MLFEIRFRQNPGATASGACIVIFIGQPAFFKVFNGKAVENPTGAVTFAAVVLAGDRVINSVVAKSAVAAGNFNAATSSAGTEANFWSATQNNANNAWYRNLSSGSAGVNRNNNNKYNGRSVRCVRD